MKNLIIIICLALPGCRDGEKKDVKTHDQEENISPNQTISEEEAHKKDSTNDANLTHENDTTLNTR